MKIAIDCRALRTSPSGIPNYIVSAINTMAIQHPDWQILLLTNGDFNPELGNKIIQTNNIQIINRPLTAVRNLSILWYVFKVYSLLKELKADVFWAPNFLLPPLVPKGTKTLVTIPDVVFKQFKHTMKFTNRLFFELLHDQSVRKADMLWAISAYTKYEIERYFPDRKCKDIFVGLSINNDIFKKIAVSAAEKKALLARFKINEKFLLFVGTLEPRKNLSFLLSLMPVLAKQGYSLLVVGARGWGQTHVKQIIQAPGYPKESVVFSGFLTTDELVNIYNIAAVYVSTSKNEGFGLPQLEAMACGCPVVSPHNSAMIEVVEGAGETVKSWHEQDWIDTINKVYSNREYYVRLGLTRVEDNSWNKIIKNLTVYLFNYVPGKILSRSQEV